LKAALLTSYTNSKFFGDGNLSVTSISSPDYIKKNSLVFLFKKDRVFDSTICNYVVFVTNEEISKTLSNHNVLVTSNPKLALAELSNLFITEHSSQKLLEPQNKGFIGSKSNVGVNLSLGCNVIIEDFVEIGNNVKIGHNVVISSNSVIGNNVTIESGSIIGSEGFGNVQDRDKNWIHICHLGGVVIEDGVSIGSNCTIDKGTIDNTIIRSGVIIDNQVHVAHNVEIGEKTAIAANTGIAGSCKIGKRNLIGGMVGIVDHISTVDDVVITATSSVIKDIKEPGVYSGVMPIAKHSKWKRIAFWISKLDKIIRINKLKIKS